MNNRKFHPDSWDKSARQISDDAKAFTQKAQDVLGAMTIGSLGCEGHGTTMDDAFAIIIPPSIEAMQETVDGLGRGFDNIGVAMNAVAASYRFAEDHAENEAGKVGP